ncbi:MAG: protoporphyrinogen oxidase [Planctomycetes bacterium]|nr:protoporphyrinogen oxidase [Planctomycetota bacterium]
MTTPQHDVIVVGAGISGLTTAWHLKQAGVDVKILEANAYAGGVMQTQHRDGFLLEKGPFNVLVRDESFEQLLLHFQDKLDPISASGSSGRSRFVLHRSRLCKLPSNPWQFITTPLLSPIGKLRLIRGLLLSRRGTSANRSIDEAAARRFGREVADRLVSALCVGIYAAESKTLSLAGCFHGIAEMDDRLRSPLISALTSAFKTRRPKRQGLVSFRNGLSALPKVIAEDLGDDLITNCDTKSIKQTQTGFEISYIINGGIDEIIRCRHLVLCVGKSAASTLLKSAAPTLASEISSIPTSPLTVLNLGFDRKHIGHPLDGFGFLVPSTEPDFPLLGVLWADSVFPHHAPKGSRLLRVFIRDSHTNEVDTKSDNELVDIAVTSLRNLLQLTGEPTLVDICHWPNAIPHYTLDHVNRVANIERQLQSHANLHLLGNYLHGMSINDCVKNAAQEASGIITKLSLQKDIKDDMSQQCRQLDHSAIEPKEPAILQSLENKGN